MSIHATKPEAEISYPIKLKCSKQFLEELQFCESGRENDAQRARQENDTKAIEFNEYEVVFNDFSDRWKTIIEIRNDLELCETYYALASGTIGVNGFSRQANRLLDEIKDFVLMVNPQLVKQFPFQNGF